jgi:outer membrane protein TolC
MKNQNLMGWMVVWGGMWLLFFPSSGRAQEQELGLKQVLQLAEKNSPSLKAVVYRQNETAETARAADAGFFPTLDVAAVDTSGFPGSASGLDGFSGLVASPYRKGAAADAFAKWDLLDLSQWSRSAEAHDAYDASREGAKFQIAVLDQKALEIYLDTIRSRGERESWQGLADELTEVKNTVERFIRNGQYSEVQGLLIEDQLADALSQVDDYDRQYQAGLARLALVTGLGDKSFSCPSPSRLTGGEFVGLSNSGESPFISQAQLEAKAAREAVSKYSAQNLPKLEVAGSAGFMDDTRLEPSQDYSVFVGVTLPVFEGFRIDAEQKGAEAEAQAREADVDAAKLALDDLNVGYTEAIQESQAELKTLLDEQAKSTRAVALAKQRYLSFLGPLSDLQQALKDMVGVDSRLADVKTRLLLAQGDQYFVNGGQIDAIP